MSKSTLVRLNEASHKRVIVEEDESKSTLVRLNYDETRQKEI